MNSATIDSKIDDILAQIMRLPGALLPVLHRLQALSGYVPAQSIPVIAAKLNLSRAEVHGVICFYHHFHSEPAGIHTVKICRGEACQAVGGRGLERHVKNRLKVEFGETSKGGQITLEPVYCLGNCACGPVYVADVAELFDAGFCDGHQSCELSLGLTDEIPYLKNQQWLIFSCQTSVSLYVGSQRALDTNEQAI